MSVALGFDSYLVKVHNRAACYFCVDTDAPSDGKKFRSLDQQCTVTRPGLAPIAAGVASELFASYVQAEGGLQALRSKGNDDNVNGISSDARATESVLGSLPDQIRGFLHNWTTTSGTTEKSDKCPACSKAVVEAFADDMVGFVDAVCRDASVIERVCGLTDLISSAEAARAQMSAQDDF